MTKRKTNLPTAFTTAVNTELRMLMVRNGITQQQLEKESGVSQSVLSRTLYNNESALNTNQLESLCKALGDIPSAVLSRAEDFIAQQNAKSQFHYALAAYTSEEEKGVDYE